MSKQVYYVVICIIASSVFFTSNQFLGGYLSSPEHLGKEIQSPKDSLYEYNLIKKAPFKYRILFTSIVKSSFELLFDSGDSDGFYYSYKAWSLLFVVAASCLFFYLLTLNGFNDSLSFAGTCVFLLLPPLLMAYTVPVHTREDPLGYCILFLGLILIIKNKSWFFLIVALVGALCRETLLLLPLLYFLFSKDQNLIRKLLITGLPCVLWVLLRLLMEKTPYDSLEGFHWNNNNPEQVVGFLFLTYNILWLPVIFFILKFKTTILQETNNVRLFFYKSSLVALGLILLTTYLGGIYNEIRLLYLGVPWVIVISLTYFEKYSDDIFKIIRSGSYVIFVVLCLVGAGCLLFFTLKYQQVLIKPGRYKIPYHLWIIISVIYFTISLVLMPAFVKVFLKNKQHESF
ncbi:MAG TPA: hypothetical protein VIM65_03095 [Cyclobacteriaceae bacterium]